MWIKLVSLAYVRTTQVEVSVSQYKKATDFKEEKGL